MTLNELQDSLKLHRERLDVARDWLETWREGESRFYWNWQAYKRTEPHSAMSTKQRGMHTAARGLDPAARAERRNYWYDRYWDARVKVAQREAQVNEEEQLIARRKAQAGEHTPIRLKAYDEAAKLIGVMERGGNNVGEGVEKIIAEGGGLPGQAWCGWFCAAVYKRAGSEAPTWHWGAVRLYLPLSGVSRTSSPERGDLVRFTFSHIGMFVKDNGNGTITTIEGNTGATGAVSDSVTGGDGVYRKTRSKGLVRDYLRITR